MESTSIPNARAAKPEKLLVTHALTLNKSEYSADMIACVKPVENRSKQIGPGWLALHNGAACDELPSHIVAVARFGKAPRCEDVLITDVPADVEAAMRKHVTGPICNVVVEIQALANPVPCSGSQGLWPMTDNTRARVVADISTLESTTTGFEDLIQCVHLRLTAP